MLIGEVHALFVNYKQRNFIVLATPYDNLRLDIVLPGE